MLGSFPNRVTNRETCHPYWEKNPTREEDRLFDSLNPRVSVLDLMSEILITDMTPRHPAPEEWAADLVVQIGLDEEIQHRDPHKLSDGWALRVAPARALAPKPEAGLVG